MKETRTSIEIQATPARVWQVLTDFDSYPKWQSFTPRISGVLEEGKCLTASTDHTTTQLLLHTVELERELCWSGVTRGRNVSNWKIRLLIEPIGPDFVRFVRCEVSSGLFAFLSILFFGSERRVGREFNEALKRRAEGSDLEAVAITSDETVWPPPPIGAA